MSCLIHLGKTHTLYGTDEEPGIISLCAQDLFNKTKEHKKDYMLR